MLLEWSQKGWRLALAVGEKEQYNLKGLLFKDENHVKKVLGLSVVFVHLSEK